MKGEQDERKERKDGMMNKGGQRGERQGACWDQGGRNKAQPGGSNERGNETRRDTKDKQRKEDEKKNRDRKWSEESTRATKKGFLFFKYNIKGSKKRTKWATAVTFTFSCGSYPDFWQISRPWRTKITVWTFICTDGSSFISCILTSAFALYSLEICIYVLKKNRFSLKHHI